MNKTALQTSLRQYFPFLHRAKAAALPRGEMLALRPVRSREIAWQPKADNEPGVTLTVPRRDDRFGRIVSRVFQIPATKAIELDEFGAAVWEKCDGRHSVEQLIGFTCRAYTLNRRQGEVSVVTFLRMLAQRRLIGLEKIGLEKIGPEKTHRTEAAHGNRNERQRTAPKARSRRRH